MPDIDNLSIKIKAESDTANRALSDLIENLEKMTSALQSVWKADNILGIEKAAKTLSNAFSGNIGTKISDIGNSFSNIGESAKRALKPMQSIGKVELKDLENQLSEVNAKIENAEKAVANVQSRTTAHGKSGFKATEAIEAENTLNAYKKQRQEIESQIQAVQNASKKLEQMNLNLKNIKVPEIDISGAKELNSEYEKTLKNLSKLKSTLSAGLATGRITESAGDTTYVKIREQIAIAEKQAEQLREKTRDSADNLSSFYSKLSSLKPTISFKGLDLKELESSLNSEKTKLFKYKAEFENALKLGKITTSIDDSGYLRMSEKIAVAEKNVSALQKRIMLLKVPKSIASGFAKIGTSITKLFSKVSKLSGAFKKLGGGGKSINSSFAGGFKTVLKYAFGIRSLFTLFNKLRNAVKEGMKNLVVYDNETNASVSMLKNSLTQLKNSVAAAAAPILNALAPALDFIIQSCIKATNAINQLISALLGKGSWIHAKKLTDNYAESLKGASKAAKNGIRAFDELNVINTQNDGGNGSETAAADMFETLDVEQPFSDLAERIKEMWEKADFTELGAMVGEKIKAGLESIDWGTIQGNVSKVSKSLATFINGLVEVEGLGYTVGTSLGEGFNTALIGVNTFLDNTHWDSIGQFIGEGLNGLFDTVDWEGIGHFFAQRLNAIFTTLENIITTFDWIGAGADLATALNTYFSDTDWEGIGRTVVEGINSFFALLTSFISEVDWYGIVADLMSMVTTAIQTFDWAGFGAFISEEVSALLDMVLAFILETDWGGTIQSVIGGIGDFIAHINWGELLLKIIAAIDGIIIQIPDIVLGAVAGITDFVANIFSGLGLDSVAGFFKGISDKLTNLRNWLKENLVDPFINGAKALFGIHSPSTVMAEIGNFLMDGLFNGVKELVGKVVGIFGDIKAKISEKWEEIKTNTSQTWENIKTGISGKWENIKTSVSNGVGNVKSFVSGAWDSIKNTTSNIWGSITDTVSSTAQTIAEKASSIFDKIGQAKDKIADFFSSAKSLDGISISAAVGVTSALPKSITGFASGGFIGNPHSYSLFMAGENGIPEMLGTVGGQPAVAGGQEITGISDTIRTETARQNELLRQQNQLLQALLEKDTGLSSSDLFNSVKHEAYAQYKRTGDNQLVF